MRPTQFSSIAPQRYVPLQGLPTLLPSPRRPDRFACDDGTAIAGFNTRSFLHLLTSSTNRLNSATNKPPINHHCFPLGFYHRTGTRRPAARHDPTPSVLILRSVLHLLGQVGHFNVDIVHQGCQQCHVVGFALPDVPGLVLPDLVIVDLRLLLIPESPCLVVQSDILVPAGSVFKFAVGLVESFIQGLDLVFGMADVLLELFDML